MGIVQITHEFGLAGTNSKAGRIQAECVVMEAKVTLLRHTLESEGQMDQPPFHRIFIWVIMDIAIGVSLFLGVVLSGS
ncbi:MAG: hypothetical protein HQK57_15035 [Deltaproteobacteria bacterium]|nr:hypothetical protein [Deltaproteobacteria bacterium]MBF0526136.1 hypothetical protein [Deltaproteobacteria bacterium]